MKTAKKYEVPAVLSAKEKKQFEDLEMQQFFIRAAIEKDRKLTEDIIRDYGKRYTANLFAEEIIEHLHFWRKQMKLEKETTIKAMKE